MTPRGKPHIESSRTSIESSVSTDIVESIGYKYMDHEPTVPSTLMPVDFDLKPKPASNSHPILKIVVGGFVLALVLFLLKR